MICAMQAIVINAPSVPITRQSSVLAAAPDYSDAKIALMNVAWWSGQRAEALDLSTQILARELGPSGINVNCVAPGFFLTPLVTSSRTPEEMVEHVRFRTESAVLRRPGRLEELAAAVLFFAGISMRFVWQRMRVAVLVLGSLFLLYAIVLVARLPIL